MTDRDTMQEQSLSGSPVPVWRSVDAGCEESAAVIGLAIATGTGLSETTVRLLARVQNDLIDATAHLRGRRGESDSPVRLDRDYVRRLDEACEHFDAGLAGAPAVLPGGTPAGAALFMAHTVVTRVRHLATAAGVDPLLADYLGSLARLLLILGRHANLEHGDTLWQPGETATLGDVPLWEPVGSIGVI